MSPHVASHVSIEEVIAGRAVRAHFQPIVDLVTGETVAYEALARGPEGTPLESPAALFAAARENGLLAELDWACRFAAARDALAAGLRRPTRLFINVAAEAVDAPPPDDAAAMMDELRRTMDVVYELTEQSITSRPAEMLHVADRVRAVGCALAVDDVGTDPASLALVPLVAPEVIKLDLRLVQERPSATLAEVANAVAAEAERSGAAIVAEGIETPEQVDVARALGAGYGQGWLFGRPSAVPEERSVGSMRLARRGPGRAGDSRTPFEIVSAERTIRRGDKGLLLSMSRQLESQAIAQGASTVLLATFQEARHFTPRTAARYAGMAENAAFVGALALDLPREPAPGVRGAGLEHRRTLAREWIVTVTSPHFAAAFTARDLGDDGPDMARRFDFAMTYDRELAVRAARALMREVAPAG